VTIRNVLLDAGNTLVEIDYEYFARAVRMAGGAASADSLRLAEQRARVRLDPHLGRGSTETEDTRRLYFGLVLEELGEAGPREPELVFEALAAFGNPWRVADPAARAALEELRARGRRLGVVSNSDGSVERLLARLGLREPLDVVVDSAVVGVEKPDPSIFRIALRAMGAVPEETVYVGDIPSIDGAGSRAAGIGFVLVDPRGLWAPEIAAPRLRRLRDLPDLIDALDGERSS
jgi:putative hydrolase of the HAD superfamily